MRRLAAYLLLCALLCGCGDTADQEVPAPSAIPEVVATTGTIEQVESTNKQEEQQPESSPKPDEASEETPQAAFEPPFPDRENLFLAPKRTAAQTRASGTGEQSVELLGFANVSGPRVILSINGTVVPIAEGGQEAGIEVISIQPPAVVLQRDRERWQATLEN